MARTRQQQQQQQGEQQQGEQARHLEPPEPLQHEEQTTAQMNARRNAQLVYELQRKWRKPTTTLGRLHLFLRTLLFRTDFIMGAYFFDGWETALVYSFYFLLLIIACVSAYKQLTHGVALCARLWQQAAGAPGSSWS